MSVRDANCYTVLGLKKLLKIHGLSTFGAKEDLIDRLNIYGLLGAAGTSSFRTTVTNNEVAGRDRDLELRRENALLKRELELMRRELDMTKRELDMTKRELKLHRNMQRSTATANRTASGIQLKKKEDSTEMTEFARKFMIFEKNCELVGA